MTVEEDLEEDDLDSGPDSSETPSSPGNEGYEEDPDLARILADLALRPNLPEPLIEIEIPNRPLNYYDYQQYTPRYFEPIGSQGGSYQELDDERTESIITDLSMRLYSREPLSLWSLSKRLGRRNRGGNFPGGGIYALYYRGRRLDRGDPLIYASIRSEASHLPIYIGKSFYLEKRFRQHIATLRKSNIPVEDLTYKLIVLSPPWILHVEENLIRRYKPVWNGLRGFGSGDRERGWGVHTPGRTTNWSSYHSNTKKPIGIREEKPWYIGRG